MYNLKTLWSIIGIIFGIFLLIMLSQWLWWTKRWWSSTSIPSSVYTISSFPGSGDNIVELKWITDPLISWITCYYSNIKPSWIKNTLGLLTDIKIDTFSCVQTSPLNTIPNDISWIWHTNKISDFNGYTLQRSYDKYTQNIIYTLISENNVTIISPLSITLTSSTPLLWN